MDDLQPGLREDIKNRIESTNQLTGDYNKDAQMGLFKEFKPTEYSLSDKNFGNDAISRKAMKQFYDPAIGNIQAQQKAGYAGEVQKKMQGTQQLGLGQLRFDNARALAAAQRAAQEEAQRAAFISSLFQVGGMAAGGAFGGPTGAMIGGQAGAAAGGAAAGGGMPGQQMKTPVQPDR